MTAEPLRVRRLGLHDLARVVEIERASFTTPWSEATFRGLVTRQDSDLMGADLDGRLIGYVVCWTVAGQSELGNVAVAEEVRRGGVASALVRGALERLVERGSQECFLEVRVSNLAAQALYQAHGFEIVGRRRRYYRKPTEDALLMRLPLPPPA
ncbi:ribosomal protein S18-alanine N-acetyltransferase [soil metagenome]